MPYDCCIIIGQASGSDPEEAPYEYWLIIGRSDDFSLQPVESFAAFALRRAAC